MTKRPYDRQHESRPAKRTKHDQPSERTAVEEIQFARHLKHLLAFQQDGIQQLRHGIASFKAFLDGILYHEAEDDRARQLSILREFLDSEKPADIPDTERPFLGSLWQAWSFASQNNNERLVSSISAIFALLLKTLSTLLDFRDHGLLLSRTVLQHQHLRLVKRSLDAPKQKDFLISPCLRMMIEVASFDGGVLAREVYKRRELTFDVATLRRNLGLVKTDLSEEELQRRPSIRTWTVRYILVLLKYLHEGGKIDLLKSRPLCTGLFHHLKDDPSDVAYEILSETEQNVLKDNELPRSAKASMLVQQNLERVVEVATRSQNEHKQAEKAFSWLRTVCTTPAYGVLRTSGWYPPGTSIADDGRRSDDIIDLGLDSIDFYDRNTRPDVRNTTLLAWIQTLRPHSNLQERELVLTCFTSAPELVAAYFAEKNMQLDPKLSNTWIGYASFLCEVVQLPVPEFLGHENEWALLPPQTNTMIESILPRPLTQKVLTRCLNQNSDLITFFAVRILIVAFEKLAKIRSQLNEGANAADKHSDLWDAASERLLTRFVERSPKIKDVIGAFRKAPDDDEHVLQREALTRLLRLCYEITPLQAMEEPFDISTALATALVRDQSTSEQDEIVSMRALALEHLLQIARNSPGMRWFSKHGSLELSPIVVLLQIHRRDFQNRQIRKLIHHVLVENSVLISDIACDALVASLIRLEEEAFKLLAPYLDDWLVRVTRKPVKYLDDLDILVSRDDRYSRKEEQTPQLSLFVAVLLEQARFVLGSEELTRTTLVAWINVFLQVLRRTEEESDLLQSIQNSILGLEGWTNNSLTDGIEDGWNEVRLTEPSTIESTDTIDKSDAAAPFSFSPPPTESQDHPELFRWTKKDLDIAIEEGDIGSLMLCLCSQYLDIRVQARTQLQIMLVKLRNSTLEDKDAIYVLIGELIETYEEHCLPKSEALPYLAGTFATNALRVQIQAAHYMYPKINKYLNKGPEWRIRKLPTYWIENTVLSQPEEDDAYWKEVQWVLSWFVDGLRTVADLEILRRSGVFERVMSLYGSPGVLVKGTVREKVLELLWRATFIEGGSTTLITRAGVLSWLNVVNYGDTSIEGKLRGRMIETCDWAKIKEWSGVSVDKL